MLIELNGQRRRIEMHQKIHDLNAIQFFGDSFEIIQRGNPSQVLQVGADIHFIDIYFRRVGVLRNAKIIKES